jgi:hypothetical protein
VALTLEELRSDHPEWNITVAEALKAYRASLQEEDEEEATDILAAAWRGEFSRYDVLNDRFVEVFDHNQTKLLFVPSGTEVVNIELTWSVIDLVDRKVSTLTWTVDFGFDGSVDEQGEMTPSMNGVRTGAINTDSGNTDQVWAISVTGEAAKLHDFLQDRNYVEVRVEYSTTVTARLTSAEGMLVVPPHPYTSMYAVWRFSTPSPDYTAGTVVMERLAYNLTKVVMAEPPPGDDIEADSGPGWGWLWWLVLAALVVLVVLLIARRRGIPVRQLATTYVKRGRSTVVRITRRKGR